MPKSSHSALMELRLMQHVYCYPYMSLAVLQCIGLEYRIRAK
jgi:hypothetical protein